MRIKFKKFIYKNFWFLLITIVAVILRIFFWLYTGRTWDDAMIPLAYAKNFVQGFGLTHHLGEVKVMGFTSPVEIIILTVGQFLINSGLTLIRLSSLVATIFTLIYAYKICKKLGLDSFATLFYLFFLSFEQNQIFYSMTGLETQIAVGILLSSIYYVLVGDVYKIGISFGLSLLVRPEFILWVIPALCFLIITKRYRAIIAVYLSALLVLLWIVFSLSYYGTILSHNLLAKVTAYVNMPSIFDYEEWFRWLFQKSITNISYFWHYFSPFFSNDFIITTPLPKTLLFLVALIIIILALYGVWFCRRKKILYPTIVYLFLFFIYRSTLLPRKYFIWHIVPFIAVVLLFTTISINEIYRLNKLPAFILGIILMFFIILPLPYIFNLERRVQIEIEDKVRKNVGTYLKEAIKRNEIVVLEPLGHIGYYAGPNVTIYDYPGLASKNSLETMLMIPVPRRTYLFPLVDAIKPEWLVFRGSEWDYFKNKYNTTSQLYQVRNYFSRQNGGMYFSYGGVKMYNVDFEFYVLRRLY